MAQTKNSNQTFSRTWATRLCLNILKENSGDLDRNRYQTVYAKELGAVAAPTAGLHFSEELMKRLEIKGINFAEVTLHVGLGTFRTIDVEDLSKHKMDAEYFRISQDASGQGEQGQEGK